MLLKGAMREKQAPKTWCLAEKCHGDSQEACIALRVNNDPGIPCIKCQRESRNLGKREEGVGHVTPIPSGLYVFVRSSLFPFPSSLSPHSEGSSTATGETTALLRALNSRTSSPAYAKESAVISRL